MSRTASLSPVARTPPIPKPTPSRRTSPPNPRGRAKDCLPVASEAPFQLTGDLTGLELAFLSSRRHLIGTTVPESVHASMQRYPGGIGGFYEDAVTAFDGDLESLVRAALTFIQDRKRQAARDPSRSANGRVSEGTAKKVSAIQQALAGLKGSSRAKILAGLIQLSRHKLQP